MITASSVGAVVAGTAIVNTDARTLIANTIFSDPAELSAMAVRAQVFGRELVRTAADYRAANGPMVWFIVFALVLTFLMLRT